ncbi:MAG TPA: hypothetical protein VGN01_18235 [Acidobacteriaceae bacterium]|jgi:hypothetical protein
MRLSSMIFVLVLASASLAAQTSTGNSPVVLVKPPAVASCPVQLSVDRIPNGGVVRTKGTVGAHGQGLNLTFVQPKVQIVAADITVHFYPAGGHVVPAAPSAASVPLTETFHLTTSADTPMRESSIWTSHTAVVRWVELTRLEYADGTSWQASAPRQCGAAPSLYVLVDSAR